MQWIEISVVCDRVATEEVTTLFHDMTDNGVIEEDVDDSRIKITVYADPSQSFDSLRRDIAERFQERSLLLHDISIRLLDEKTWYNSWQRYIEPVEILPHIIIKPVWQTYEESDKDVVIEIDTDLSFGTGTHETTQSCARLLHRYIRDSKQADNTLSCLDIGTGTGILLLVAAKLGISRLTGIDIDPASAEQARLNCLHNHVTAHIIHGNLAEDYRETADVILANLTVDPLKELLPVVSKHLHDDGLLIISGIIDDRYDEIMPYITEHWQIKEELTAGVWHTFALGKLK